jgi:hypothetical protein
MTAANVFRIEAGKVAFATTDPGITSACSAALSSFPSVFSCQVTEASLQPTANVTQDTIPGTFCEPEEQRPRVGRTSYTLNMVFLQDPHILNGLSRFLMEFDTQLCWFYLGFDGDDPPKATGKVRITAGALGGVARTVLTAPVNLPVDGTPMVCFGDEDGSINIGGNPPDKAAVHPADVFPAEPTVTASDSTNAAKLGPLGYVAASGATAWTTGQSFSVGAFLFNWSGTAWAAGAHA